MKIKEHIDQINRDFWASYECEHCLHVWPKKVGYDDGNFHKNVIPSWHCDKCGKNRAGKARREA